MRASQRETVLVLEAHGKASLPVIESCAAMGLRVIAATPQRFACGLYSRCVRERFRYPPSTSKPAEAIAAILGLLRRREIAVLFPVGDVMTDLIARHQDELRRHTRLVLPPYDIFVKGRSKIPTLQAAARAGCPIPLTWYPAEEPIDQIAAKAVYPCLIKPTLSAGARGITICNSAPDLLARFAKVAGHYGECFVQEYVPQTGMQYKADLIIGPDRELLSGVVYAKLRYYPPTGGSSVLNRTEHRPDILKASAAVCRELGWTGFCDFDFITDPRDNVVKLMEINPRYPESYRATVAAGVDMTKIMYQLAKGEKPVPQLDYTAGRYLRFLPGDIMWFLTTRDNRWAARPSFFDFFRADTLEQLIRARDLGPIMGYLLENVQVMCNKQARDFRLRRQNL